MLEQIAQVVKDLVGNDYLYFDTALLFNDYSVWAVTVSPNNLVYVMDSDEDWYSLEKEDSYTLLLLERVQQIQKQYLQTSNS